MVIGYSTFRKLKPWSDLKRHLQIHDKWEHGIFGWLFEQIRVLAQKSLTYCKEIFCCTPQTEQCLSRKCVKCPYPDLTTKLSSDCSMVRYFKWVYVKETIVIKKTVKEKVITKVAETPVTQPTNNPWWVFVQPQTVSNERGKNQAPICHIKSL